MQSWSGTLKLVGGGERRGGDGRGWRGASRIVVGRVRWSLGSGSEWIVKWDVLLPSCLEECRWERRLCS